MIYLDTSVLVALHTLEPATAALHDWYGALDAIPLATATWTMTEFASVLGVKRRTRQMTARQTTIAWRSFDEQCSADLILIDSERSTFVDAAALVRADADGLRAGDALHLAVARKCGATVIASLDRILSRHALKLGIAAVDFSRRTAARRSSPR